ncbi:MAG: hypothetical protein AAF572_21100 [Cyanobacteria bacterium P01_B01_bin.77]
MSSIFSVIFAMVLVVAVFCWLTGYRLPIRFAVPSLPTGSASVSRTTRQRLMRLVNGNQSVAARLVQRVRSQHPERSEQWCWEKAIYDIERDRRA